MKDAKKIFLNFPDQTSISGSSIRKHFFLTVYSSRKWHFF